MIDGENRGMQEDLTIISLFVRALFTPEIMCLTTLWKNTPYKFKTLDYRSKLNGFDFESFHSSIHLLPASL